MLLLLSLCHATWESLIASKAPPKLYSDNIVPFNMDFPSHAFNPLPDDKILDWSKLKQIVDNILKCIQNER